ncbi:MAG: DUF599 domain-containing protein [Pseudomonadota bacterium]
METLSLPVLAVLGPMDLVALAVFVAVSWGMGWFIERPNAARPSMSRLIAIYRRRWMHELLRRSNWMFDASLLISLRQGAAFFASGLMIAIGGVVALLGQTQQLVTIAQDIAALETLSAVAWEAKLLFILVLLVDAFLKFVWSHRLFGYCAVLMGAIPENGEPQEASIAADRAADLNITASRSFNRGLRRVYFAIASLAWFLGAEAWIAASLLMAAMLYRREFLSASRQALADVPQRS